MHQCPSSIRGGWIKHLILIIHIIESYDQNISLDFVCERLIPCQAVRDIRLVFTLQYTAVQKMRTSLKYLSLHYKFVALIT